METSVKQQILITRLLLMSCLLWQAGCTQNKKFQDNSALEKPPQLEIIETAQEPVIDENVNTGLGEAVILSGGKLILKQPFNKAWNTLGTALEFMNIEITDRNRENGEYFVNYDPDNANRKNGELLDDVSFFLFEDQYANAPYKLNVSKKEESVEVTSEKLDSFQMDLLDDNEDIKFDDRSNDGSRKLIRHLYGVLKNDLPLD